MSCLNTCSQKVDGALSGFFYSLGKAVGANPVRTVVISLLVALGLLAGLADFQQEGRPEKLFNPSGIREVEDSNDARAAFGSPTRIANVIFEPKSGNNVVTKANLGALFDYQDFIFNIEVEEEVDGGIAKFQEKCARFPPLFQCLIITPLSVWENKTVMLADPDIGATLGTIPQADLKLMLGGLQMSGGSVVSAEIINLNFFFEQELEDRVLDGRTVTVDLEIDAIEREILDYSFGLDDFKNDGEDWRNKLELYPRLSASFGDEVGGAIVGDVPIQTASYVVIITYILIAVQTKRGRVTNSFAIGGLAVVTILMGIAGGIGAAQLLDIPYGNTHTILVFIILGIGADGCFILLSSFRRTSPQLENSIRAAEASAHAGVSLTVTSITNVVAFSIGSLTAIPDLSSFCRYAALAQLLLYIFQNTFFVACIVLNERRVESNRLDCLCCVKSSKPAPEKDTEPGSTIVSRFMGQKYAPFLLQSKVKIVVLVFAVGFISFMGYSVSNLTVEATGDNFIPDGSYLKDNLELSSEYFGGLPNDVDVVIKEVDYHAKRSEILGLPDKFQKPGFDTKPPYLALGEVEFWFTQFVADFNTTLKLTANPSDFVASDPDVGGGAFPVDEPTLIAFVQNWTDTQGAKFKGDIAFQGNKISRSRANFQHVPIGEFKDGIFKEDAQEAVNAVNKMYEICDSFSFDAYPTAPVYTTTWASYAIVLQELVTNVSFALLSVLIVTGILIGHPVASGLVFLTVVITILELLGMQTLIGYSIDTVVVVLTILAVGLSVDYAAHIGHCFMTKQGTRDERLIATLEDIGAPVLNGALSTFLAVLFQAFSQSYVFRVVFFDFFCAILFGCLNGLVLLPVLLSYVGPAAYTRDEVETKKDVAPSF